jgi:hypothetical protein
MAAFLQNHSISLVHQIVFIVASWDRIEDAYTCLLVLVSETVAGRTSTMEEQKREKGAEVL